MWNSLLNGPVRVHFGPTAHDKRWRLRRYQRFVEMDVVMAIHRQAGYGNRSAEIQLRGATAAQLEGGLRCIDDPVECRIAFVINGRIRRQAEILKGTCTTSIIDYPLAADGR